MPLYEYHCSGCGKDYEVLEKFSNDKKQCPNCGKVLIRGLSTFYFANFPIKAVRVNGQEVR